MLMWFVVIQKTIKIKLPLSLRDESLFQGKRKYNNSRLRLGDCKPTDELIEF